MTYEIERNYLSYPSKSQSNLYDDMKEVLQSKVKGYREATYWGAEHPLNEELKYFDNDEFDRLIEEEAELKDPDVYWGAKY